MSSQVTTMGNFLNFPQTQEFLKVNLADKKTSFISNLLAITDSDKNLADCEPAKLMKCAMNATALDLPLNKNLGYAYVIAYKGIPSFQIGYKGLIQLAIRSGQYKYLNSVEIRENEIERNKFTGEVKFLGENPEGKIIGYLAYLRLLNGFTASVYMTESQIEKHALKYSTSYSYDKKQGKKSSKWSDPHARIKMALKTVLKQLLNTYGILSVEMVTAMQNDTDFEQQQTVDVKHEVVQQDEPKKTTTKETKTIKL